MSTQGSYTTNYPGPWIGGHIPINPHLESNRYWVGKSVINGKRFYNTFHWGSLKKSKNNFDTKDEAFSACNQWIREKYEEEDAIKNQYRFINENQVEVKLNLGKTMIIDRDNIEELEKAIWHVQKGRNTFYCVTRTYGEKCRSSQFHKMITDYDIVDHIDG